MTVICMTVGERIKAYREKANLTQAELGKSCGISKQAICNYEKNLVEDIPISRIEKIAEALEIESAYLIGWKEEQKLPDNIQPMPKMYKVPRLGTIACGEPILAEQNIEAYDDVPEHVKADFTLVCKGDSMINARIYNGDIVYIRQQPTVESGEIAAVLIGEEATLKRVRLYSDHIVLEPENPQYRPLAYWGEEMNNVHILGKAVAFTSFME